ncbi:phospho-N-acetylmuramoyl-pentapeptide-transferase [bacterium]|jgi:phospho-N-acetylmuramoyl-pentapeptide-transferase|nr:phospho-N-acetylmuramoyl-pentapeptide-transferase [bacterium]MBT3580902.1 phospho-N-acetylmuramoyl-pentapeptide-transferase [bacterium]MBT4551462.1 phospho-N-acetylmuramoyl-pentapeptide-transferase [bacterium]MBT5988477.1 phospho-N-acetylmuramoyl-pentapeptide-transferase [bacterium]
MIKLFLFVIFNICFYLALIFILKKIHIYQHIYKLTPETHQSKKHIPSFGGLGILIGLLLSFFLFRLYTPETVWLLALTIVFGLIGLTDDLLSTFHRQNKGLSAKQKMLLQTSAAFIFLLSYSFFFTSLSFWYLVFFIFIFVGTSNATNLTDGLDGLLSGLTIFSLLGFSFYFFIASQITLSLFCLSFALTLLCFLVFNFHPAKIFMGDTGSLAIGAALAGMSLILHNPWALIFLGSVYILETLSVIIQVVSYKTRKKRVFKMAPLHHHFELIGFSEIKTVFLFWLIGFISLLLFIVCLLYFFIALN